MKCFFETLFGFVLIVAIVLTGFAVAILVIDRVSTSDVIVAAENVYRFYDIASRCDDANLNLVYSSHIISASNTIVFGRWCFFECAHE